MEVKVKKEKNLKEYEFPVLMIHKTEYNMILTTIEAAISIAD